MEKVATAPLLVHHLMASSEQLQLYQNNCRKGGTPSLIGVVTFIPPTSVPTTFVPLDMCPLSTGIPQTFVLLNNYPHLALAGGPLGWGWSPRVCLRLGIVTTCAVLLLTEWPRIVGLALPLPNITKHMVYVNDCGFNRSMLFELESFQFLFQFNYWDYWPNIPGNLLIPESNNSW